MLPVVNPDDPAPATLPATAPVPARVGGMLAAALRAEVATCVRSERERTASLAA
ncbi:hypothetical protein KZZ52_10440 [Dactylosporangium sp. AC04546]|uniref:hypothetical protein n=1 Tax=Dactylosporangium sp. AC04546 TaxID=2862460 RepID=UPI001EE09EAC|nr:hypothetical protein [Dactylosporangium sp. AC04546]WVK85776.1 hypothetical protein KZZ52_10440 [Dactylosporangium sp. AC04546]